MRPAPAPMTDIEHAQVREYRDLLYARSAQLAIAAQTAPSTAEAAAYQRDVDAITGTLKTLDAVFQSPPATVTTNCDAGRSPTALGGPSDTPSPPRR